MADPRTFTLIGEFKDGITPELQKINNQLATLKTSFSNLGGKGARNASRDMGRFSAAVSSLTDNLKANNQELRASIAPLREYRKEIGKTVGAYKQLNQAGGNVKGLEATNKALREQMRLMSMVQKRGQALSRSQEVVTAGMSQRARRAQAAASMGGGGYTPPPAPSGGGTRGGSGGGMGAHMAEFGFAFTLGNAIAQPIQSAIVQGFQIGVDLMVKPFQYFANAFGERVQDEISDLKAAGGFLSISKRSQNPFVKNIDEAIQFQQETNESFAKMAAALPGVTNDYVQVGKRLGDTAARIVNQDFKGALEEANRIRQTEEGRKFYGGQITATGPEAQREVITTLLGELTKKTTIAGLGGRSGAGGIAGAYGLPGLTERMLSQQEVSVAQFQRYAAVFSDPTISDALQRNIDKINATQMNSVDRFKAIQKLLDEVVTPELIEKLRTSVDGVYQGLKSVIFDPDTGLFGLGRNFKAFGKRINQYGQYVNEAGEVVKNIADAADEDLSIFEIVRDIFSNFGQALLPMVESLQLIFDPLKSVANVLMDARHYAGQFNKVFNQYREGLLELSKTKSDAFKNTVDVRASLSAINAFLKNFGVISEKDFKGFGMELMSESLDVGKMMSTMIDKILNSRIAEDIGKLIGEVIGTVLTEVAKVTGFISGRVAGTNKLFEGIKAGFDKAGGVEALKNIFSDVFKTLFKVLVEVMKLIPFEGYMLMAAMVVLPAAVQGLGMKIAEGVLAFITRLGDDIPKMLDKGPKGFKGLLPFGKGKTTYTAPVGPLPSDLSDLERKLGKTKNKGPAFMESGLRKPPSRKDFLKAAVGADESLLGKKAVDFGRGALGALKAPLASLAGALGALGPLAGKLKGLLSVIDEFTWGVKDALRLLFDWLSGEINIVGPALNKFGNYLIDVVEGVRNPFYGLTSAVQRLDDFIIRLIEGNLGFRDTVRTGAKGLAAGTKGIGVRIVGVAKNVATAAKGGLGGLLGGVKGAAGGLKGLFGKGLQGLGKFGTVATVGVGIVEALMALFSGASLGEALGKGAGPVLGTIIGTALLGPLGGIIGGMIGSLEAITEPLGAAFESIIGTLGTTFEFLGQIGSDLLGMVNGFVRMLPGVSKDFDMLRLAVTALTAPFRLLELMIIGLYEGYLRLKEMIPGLGLSAEEKRKKDELFLARMEKTAALELDFKQAYNRKAREEYQKELDTLREKGQGDQERARIVTNALKLIDEKLKKSDPKYVPPGTTGPSPAATKPTYSTPGKPGFLTLDGKTFWRGTDGSLTTIVGGIAPKPTPAKTEPQPKSESDKIRDNLRSRAGADLGSLWKVLTTTPSQAGAKPDPYGPSAIKPPPVAKEVSRNTQNTTDLNKKAADQIKKATEIKASTENTTQAVKDLTTKITSQTNLQTTTAAIYNLLASGTLQVQGTVAGGVGRNGLPPGTPLPLRSGQTGTEWLIERASDPTAWEAFGSPGKMAGSLAAAVNYENKHKPSGSDLVIANSSETVIPAAGGYGMEAFMGILTSGFTAINNQYKSLATGVNTLEQDTGRMFQQAETTNSDRYQKTTSTINSYHKENQQEFAKIGENILQLSQKVATMSSMGGMMGGLGGGMALGGGYGGAGVQIAGQLGNFIKQTGGAPGSIHEHPMHGGVKGKHAPGSYHYSGRAIDIGAYANEQAGVIARIQQFNAKYGVKPVEFLHAGNDPNHQDHVHVAYAMGPGMPAFFQEQKDAVAWEKKHLGAGIKSITTNSAELAQAGDGMMGPSWLPWNWGKLVDQERKTNKLNRTNQILEQMQRDGQLPPGMQLRSSLDGLSNVMSEVAWNTPAIPQGPYSPLRNFGSKLNPMMMPSTKDTHNNPSGQRVTPIRFDSAAGYIPPAGMNPGGNAGSVSAAPVNINAPITIHQQPGQDSEQLAYEVARHIQRAVNDAANASVLT